MVLKATTIHDSKSRRAALAADIQHTLARVPKGAPSYGRDRHYLFKALIEDLAYLHRLVPRLAAINMDTLEQLITLWRSRGNNIATVQKKIAVLRSVLTYSNIAIDFPTNRDLGLASRAKKKSPSIQSIDLTYIKHETIRQYCTLQYHFGLKKIEALRFNQDMITDKGLYLRRQITYNRRDRWVNIDEDQQQTFIATIFKQGLFNTPLTQAEFYYYNAAFQYELSQVGITNSDHFRYQFIQNRYATFQKQSYSHLAALKQLRHELGYQTNDPIYQVLSCQNDS